MWGEKVNNNNLEASKILIVGPTEFDKNICIERLMSVITLIVSITLQLNVLIDYSLILFREHIETFKIDREHLMQHMII